MLARDGEVGNGGRGSGDAHFEWAVGDVVFDEVGNPVVGLVATWRAHLACKADGQHPGRLVLAGQERAQLRCREEVLDHRDVCDVVAQRVHHLAVGGLIGLLEPGFVGEGNDEKVLRTRFVKRLGHLPGRDTRRGVAGQDRKRVLLGHLVQARERQRKRDRDRDPDPDHHQWPPHHEIGARQLATFLNEFGYTTSLIDIREMSNILHLKSGIAFLKSGIAFLGDDRLVAIDELAQHPEFRGFELIRVSPEEEYAANCLSVNGKVLMAAGFPLFEEQLNKLGLDVTALEMSEFQKMDGGLSCLSLRF